eukprot:c45284_g1_i1 orf=3-182(-)
MSEMIVLHTIGASFQHCFVLVHVWWRPMYFIWLLQVFCSPKVPLGYFTLCLFFLYSNLFV